VSDHNHGVLPFPVFTTEKKLADFMHHQLGEWFIVEPEVTGVMPGGKKVRVDTVLHAKEPWGEHHPIRFAVEFKNLTDKSWGDRRYMKWYAQAIDYSYTEWGDYGRLPILMCPQPYFEDPVTNFNLNHLAGHFLVGGIRLREYHGWEITMHGHHALWRSNEGPTGIGKKWGLVQKEGNRW
jgi:hypothetical protein